MELPHPQKSPTNLNVLEGLHVHILRRDELAPESLPLLPHSEDILPLPRHLWRERDGVTSFTFLENKSTHFLEY